MALLPFEKQMVRQYFKYYSGDIPQIPEDDVKIHLLAEANEAGKRVILKQFIQNIILPIEQVQLNNLNNAVVATQSRITQLQNYIA